MADLFLDALLDSLKVLGLSFIIYLLLSFVEDKIAYIFKKHQKTTPLIGAACGLIPQCGISVVGADLYHKESISAGTLLAIFFACSDEALPLMMQNGKVIYLIPLLLMKFIFGFILGYLTDFIIRKKEFKWVEEEVHVGCCHHEIDNENETGLHKHFLHPLVHSLKIFIYVFIINICFGLLIYYIGEERIFSVLKTNRYLSPLLSGLIGMIPNCASSVVLTEIFMMDGLPFGALLTGLCVNAGLGFIYLFKFKEERKSAVMLLGVLLVYSLGIGYMTLWVMQLMGL